MPYIDQESRDELDPQIDKLIDQIDYTNMGEINYVVTRLCDALFDGDELCSFLATRLEHDTVRPVADGAESLIILHFANGSALS